MKRFLFSILTALGLIVMMTAVALAHAKFVKSDPAPDSTVTTAPLTVTIWFNEELDTKQSSIKVADAAGATVDLGNSKVNLNERTQMAVGLKQPLANGVYTVTWHAVTADDGGISDGQFKFTLAAPAPTTPATVVMTPTRAPGTPTASMTPPSTPTGTPAATVSASPTPTGTPAATASPSPTATVTPTVAPTAAATKAPSATPAPVPAPNGDFDPTTALIVASLIIVGAGAVLLLRRK